MEKYIFLDIDGVIATQKTRYSLDSESQEMLRTILDSTGANIILTSSWRKHTLEETKEYMQVEEFWFIDKIIGQTIRAYHYLDHSKKVHLSIPRGVEIKQWLDTHAQCPWYAYPEKHKEYEILSDDGGFKSMRFGELGVDYNYVILDDDYDMLLEQKDNFIHTDSYLGINLQNVEKSIKILNNELRKTSKNL